MATTRVSRTVAFGGGAVATLILAAALVGLQIHRTSRAWLDTASAEGLVRSSAFAKAVEVWLDRHQQETIRSVAEVMVSGHY